MALPALARVKDSLALFLASFEAWGLLPPTEQLPAALLFAWYLCLGAGAQLLFLPTPNPARSGCLDAALRGAWLGKSSQWSWLLLWCLLQTLSATGN